MLKPNTFFPLLTALLLIGRPTRLSALECYTCDSAEDVECATKPGQQLNVEECQQPNDECVTAIAAGHTRRGCMSRLYPAKYCAQPCEKCQTNLCNRHVYPADRLRCYQCVGADCIDVAKKPHLVLPCPIYREEDRCYANVISINNVQRGCEFSNMPTTCPHSCFKCNYDACNNEQGVWHDSCLECTHTPQNPNPLCLRAQQPNGQCHIGEGVKRCSNKLLHGHRGKCFTYVNAQTGVVQRGCSTIKGFYPTGTLNECFGLDCNSECLTIACNSCTTVGGNESCRSGVNLRAEQCANGTFACYTCEAGAQLRRGCWDADFQLESQSQQPLACVACTNADGCNRLPVRTCYHCNSLEQPACGNWTDESVIGRMQCTAASELCVTTVVSKLGLTYTIRGCATHVPECTETDPLCARCNGSLCNSHTTSWQHKNTPAHMTHLLPISQRSGQQCVQQSYALAVVVAAFIVKYLCN